MVERCLVCGESKIKPKTDYRTLLTGMFVAGTWTFAVALSVMILQNRIIF
ncbi:MAG: hypothetical protein ACLQG5_10110 [Methanobacterium sp.]|jgi:hypothetical protein